MSKILTIKMAKSTTTTSVPPKLPIKLFLAITKTNMNSYKTMKTTTTILTTTAATKQYQNNWGLISS